MEKSADRSFQHLVPESYRPAHTPESSESDSLLVAAARKPSPHRRNPSRITCDCVPSKREHQIPQAHEKMDGVRYALLSLPPGRASPRHGAWWSAKCHKITTPPGPQESGGPGIFEMRYMRPPGGYPARPQAGGNLKKKTGEGTSGRRGACRACGANKTNRK